MVANAAHGKWIAKLLDMKPPAAWRLLVGQIWRVEDVEDWHRRNEILDDEARFWGSFNDTDRKNRMMMDRFGRHWARVHAALRERPAYYE